MKPTLVILAAGMGSRFGGLKQVQSVGDNGELIIDYSVHDALRAGFGRLVLVVRRDTEDEFRRVIGSRFEAKIPTDYVYQDLDALPEPFRSPASRAKPWGTGHAVLAASAVEEPFAVINADDFYGARSFALLADFLSGSAVDSTDYCMVGFQLKQTLSENGSVSRGICEVDGNGKLAGITERTAIDSQEGGIGYVDADGTRKSLAADSVVSMNMWGFTPSLFPLLQKRFESFLEKNAGSDRAEFYLPAAIDELMGDGKVTTRVLSTPEQWFGITYREDLESTRSAIKAQSDTGVYASPLWGGAV